MIAERLNYAAQRSGVGMSELLGPIADQYVAKLLYRQGFTLIDVQHCMAVWTNRNKVFNWINNMRFAKFGQWRDVMHMDKALPEIAICLAKV